MLENIPNNSMYTTIPQEVDMCFTEDEIWNMQNELPIEPCDYDLDMEFLEKEIAEFEDIIKNAPIGMI